MSKKYEISAKDIEEGCAEIDLMHRPGEHKASDLQVNGLYITFDLKINDKAFSIIFETEDRNSGMQAYSGCEMCASDSGDDYSEAREYFEENVNDANLFDEIIEEMKDAAEEICLRFYKQKMKEEAEQYNDSCEEDEKLNKAEFFSYYVDLLNED